MKQRILRAAMAAALIIGALCVAGCSPQSDEELIADSLSGMFDSYKNKDDDAMSTVASYAEKAQLDHYGIDSQELAAAVLDGFDYRINGVEVDGDTAVAQVTIVSKSSSDFEKRMGEAMQAMAADPSMEGLGEEETVDAVSSAVMQAFQDATIVSEDIDITYRRNGNTWEPVEQDAGLGTLDSAVFAR